MSDNPQSSSALRKALKRLAFVAGCGGVLVFIALAALILPDQTRAVPEPAARVLDEAEASAPMVNGSAFALGGAPRDASVGSAAPESTTTRLRSDMKPTNGAPTWEEVSAKHHIGRAYALLPSEKRREAQGLIAKMDALTSNLLMLAQQADATGIDRELHEQTAKNQAEFYDSIIKWGMSGYSDDDIAKDYYSARRGIEDHILLGNYATKRDYEYAAWFCFNDPCLGNKERWNAAVYYAHKGGWRGRGWLAFASCARAVMSIRMAWKESRAVERPE